MTDNISFDPYLSWVDTTDPDNLPADAKLITASDLLRYENFGVAATAAVNGLISDVAATNTTVAGHGTSITDLQDAVDGFAALQALDRTVLKSANQSRTNTTLFAADTALSLLLFPGNTYLVEAVLFVQTPTTADFRVHLNCPGVTGHWGVSTGLATTATTTDGALRPLVYSAFDGTGYAWVGGTDFSSLVVLKGVIKTPTGSNKTLAVHWAQGTADAGNTIVIADSYLRAQAL